MKNRLLVMAVALSMAGCIVKDERYTFYLEADGTVTMSVTEMLVRSDEEDPGKQAAEEREFMAEVWAGKAGHAEAMREWGAYGVEVRVTRARRPYAVTTEGHFSSVEQLARQLNTLSDGDVIAEVLHEGAVTRLRIRVRSGRDREDPDPKPWFNDALEVVLARGRFVEAKGFKLSEDGATATPAPIRPEGGFGTLELAWTR